MSLRSHLARLFVVQNHNPTWRSSIFSMVCTGLPFIAGVIFDKPLQGMLAAMFGMLLMLNDYGGDLSQRIRGQLLMIFSLLIGCALVVVMYLIEGAVTKPHNYSWLLVLFLSASTLFTGWVQGAGKLLEGFARNIALALLVVSELPFIDTSLLMFLFASALLSITARIADHLLAPRNFDAEITPFALSLEQAVAEKNNGWRYATVYSGCVVGGLLFGALIGTDKPYWIAITIMMTMRPDAALNLIRSIQRLGGTILGVALAGLIVHYAHDVWWIVAVILLLGLTLPHGIPMNYGLHCTLLASFVLLLYITATVQYAGQETELLIERVYDVILGCVIALIGTVLAFSRKTQHRLPEPYE